MQKITPFLWFNDNLEEAMNYYTSIFINSKIGKINHLADGKTATVTFQLCGREFMALNGGPLFRFTPAISFFVNCETPEEMDGLWEKLGESGQILMPLNKYPFSEKFGWVQDKFGISWQLNLTHTQQNICPFLMFVNEQHGKAEEAIHFYISLFKHSEIHRIAHYVAGEGGEEGRIKHAAFSLNGDEFMAMENNRGHAFTFTPAISFFVNCFTQEEVDYFWEKLSEGGRKDRCGWLTDKYGVSWQIVPAVLLELLYGQDQARSKKVFEAMLKMDKIDINGLLEASR